MLEASPLPPSTCPVLGVCCYCLRVSRNLRHKFLMEEMCVFVCLFFFLTKSYCAFQTGFKFVKKFNLGAGHDGACLKSQHLEGRGRQISMILRPTWSTWDSISTNPMPQTANYKDYSHELYAHLRNITSKSFISSYRFYLHCLSCFLGSILWFTKLVFCSFNGSS